MSQYDDFGDFDSPDPLTRWNAHQAAKGRAQMPDPDEIRKQQKESGRTPCTCGHTGVCTRCVLDDLGRMLP